MKPLRKDPTKAVAEQVLKEYQYLCAVCGKPGPQLHHIDEDRSSSGPENLIPLCPSCHLTDQHNPTRRIETGILILFRKFKDPTLLKPQFKAIYARLRFLEEDPSETPLRDLLPEVRELIDLVATLQNGAFFEKQLKNLTVKPYPAFVFSGEPGEGEEYERIKKSIDDDYRKKIFAARDQIQALCVEVLLFQNW